MELASLSPDTEHLVARMFPAADRAVAEALLISRCGRSLPFHEHADAVALERIRFAAVKVSGGTLAGLERAVALAEQDTRDLLMAADFGIDVDEHRHWWARVLGG